jgi:tetratricopeptide (TPR) repeat protein
MAGSIQAARGRTVTSRPTVSEGMRIEGGVRADRGGVAAGRDVVAHLLITGDRNSFFVGGYQRLGEAYIDPWSVFERVRLERFTGREWLEREVDRFVQENDRGYLIVEAKAGLGKSAFLAHLVKKRAWIHHFVELAPGQAGIVPARKSLAAQVIRAYQLAEEAEGLVLPDEAASRPDFLANLLRKAAGRRQEAEKVVLVIDGLDEAGTRPGENVLGLPRVLPAGVFFVVSRRPVPVALSVEGPRPVVTIEAGSPTNIDDVHTYLRRATSWKGIACALRESRNTHGRRFSAEEFVQTLYAKSGGVWVYLHYILSEIEDQHRPEIDTHPSLDLDTLPQGLWAYYAGFWQRWKDENPLAWYELHLPLLATLAAVRTEVSLELLCILAGVDAVSELPRRWRPFLAVTRGEEYRYRLYHTSLEEFLHGRGGGEELGEDEQDFADELARATGQAHGRIAARYLNSWGGLTDGLPELEGRAVRDLDGQYGLRHIAEHLTRAGKVQQLFVLARNERFEAIQREQLHDEPGAAIKTAELALLAARDSDDPVAMAEFALLKAHRIRSTRAQSSPLETLRIAGLEAAWDAADLYDAKSSSLWHLLMAWQLKQTGRKEEARVTLGRLRDRPLSRIDEYVFRPLFLHAWEVDASTALALQRILMTDDDRAWLVERLTSRGDLEGATSVLEEVDGRGVRDTALAALAQGQAETGDLSTAKKTAHGIADEKKRASALLTIASVQIGAGDQTGVAPIVTEITTPGERARVHALLAAAEAEAGDELAAGAAFSAASRAAERVADERERAEVLAVIAASHAFLGDTDAARNGFAAALRTAKSIDAEYSAGWALFAVAVWQAHGKDFQAALTTSRSIENEDQRATALASIGAAQVTAGQRAAAHEVFEEALRAALARDKKQWQARSIANIARRQAEAGEVQWARASFARAEETARAIDDASERAGALADIAMAEAAAGEEQAARESYALSLRGEYRSSISSMGRDIRRNAHAIADAYNQADELLETVKRQVTADDRAALSVAQQIRVPDKKAEALATIAAEHAHFTRAMEQARTITSDPDRARVLATIAVHQTKTGDEAAAGTSFAEAFAIAQGLTDERQQAEALASIAVAYASAGDMISAEHTLEQIEAPRQKVNALTKIARAHVEAEAHEAAEAAFTAATGIAENIPDESARAEAFLVIASAQAAVGNVEAARTNAALGHESAKNVADKEKREYILKKVATTYAEIGNDASAREAADAIEDKTTWAGALSEVAGLLAASGRGDSAIEIAEAVGVDRGEVLRKIAEGFVRTRDTTQFKRIISACMDDPESMYRIPSWFKRLYPSRANEVTTLIRSFGVE